MKRSFLLFCSLFVSLLSMAKTIVVKNIAELNAASKEAVAGDIIILEDGEWRDAPIVLSCSGTKERPIILKAKTPGKVLLTGHSYLKLGGNYLVVDGLHFTKGFAGDNAVIDFRIDKNQLANNCRVTNCVVDNFNNAKRMDDNDWVTLSGKNNRIDHCSFINKKNMGVLLAVLLDDDRSRENFHSIDHNYFGVRVPLASNGGEIIRVGLSQHCQFNSHTNITDNFFEKCDGEAEVISIKSGANIIRGNVFKECQGSVVLRHGDNNTVENNIFLGNGKQGTGGVRVINRGQWVVNNLFYRCRGEGFRAPLAMMNGVPNSPAHRYVQVTDAVIANNSFVDCAPMSLCEGSDTERSMTPDKVVFANNIFHTISDSLIYYAYDNISGIQFAGNKISRTVKQTIPNGFAKAVFLTQKDRMMMVPTFEPSVAVSDSLQQAALNRLKHKLEARPGFNNYRLAKAIVDSADTRCGAKWITNHSDARQAVAGSPGKIYSCSTAGEVYDQVSKNKPVMIYLTGRQYVFDKPLYISNDVTISAPAGAGVSFKTTKTPELFILRGKGRLWLNELTVDGNSMEATNFIASDTIGSSDHYNLMITRCSFNNFDRKNGCENFFYAHKYMVADKILIDGCEFTNNSIDHFVLNAEKDDRGYYNAELIILNDNKLKNVNGRFLDVYRGGTDESTLGPQLGVTDNKFVNCSTTAGPFIQLTGVQRSIFQTNTFDTCNAGRTLIVFKDIVRADHLLEMNIINGSGKIESNKFVRTRQ